MMIRWAFIFAFVFAAQAQAEFVGAEITSDDNEAVIEPIFFNDLTLEDPVFSSRKSERDIASKENIESLTQREVQGQLRVVKEIPYSFQWVSHQTMQLRVLAEIEEEEAKASN